MFSHSLVRLQVVRQVLFAHECAKTDHAAVTGTRVLTLMAPLVAGVTERPATVTACEWPLFCVHTHVVLHVVLAPGLVATRVAAVERSCSNVLL